MAVRIAVTGRDGQVATALREVTLPGLSVVPVSRPIFDLSRVETVLPALAATRPDVIVSAAAYTAVDKAESERGTAFAVNAIGGRAVAEAAATLGVPLIHLSTDYVFNGAKSEPYVESDAVDPINVYGASKLASEKEVAVATGNYVILRTAWVFSSGGSNFVRTMLNLSNRHEVRVVCDQFGCPTYAQDIAHAIVKIAADLSLSSSQQIRGVFHLVGSGDTNWADFAHAIFVGGSERGLVRAPTVVPISSADYPTAARRPRNSRLNCGRIFAEYSIVSPDWRSSLALCLDKLARTQVTEGRGG